MGRVVQVIRADDSAPATVDAPLALSPWPREINAASAAVAYLRPVIGATDNETAERLGGIAAAMVEQYASAAPQVARNEAVIRFAGYLLEASPGSHRSEKIGELSVDHANHASAFRNCGAAALLGRWRVRRAGAIG